MVEQKTHRNLPSGNIVFRTKLGCPDIKSCSSHLDTYNFYGMITNLNLIPGLINTHLTR